MAALQRKSLLVNGIVQGVGFRFFVSRLANEMGLLGWVRNTNEGQVEIDVEGSGEQLDEFVKQIQKQKPFRARVDSIEQKYLESKGFTKFEIKETK